MEIRTTINYPIKVIITIFVAANNQIVTTAISHNVDIHPLALAAFSTTYFKQQPQPRCRSLIHSLPTLQMQQKQRHVPYRPPRQRHTTIITAETTSTVLASLPTNELSAAAPPLLEYVANTAASATESALEYVSSTVARKAIHRAPILSLIISFILGGIFFSTVAAAFAGVIALGKENTRRLKEVLAIVFRRNWSVMKISMMFTMDVLRGKEKMSGFKNRFPAALQALKDGVAEVKRVFTESVDAIKKETQLYSAAVGLPGLIPIQYIFDRIFPSMLSAPFEAAMEDALLQMVRENPQIRSLSLKRFTLGKSAPRILEARLFDLGEKDMAFDLEMSWSSSSSSPSSSSLMSLGNGAARADLELSVASTILGAKIPVTIQNIRFDGPVRLILVGLRREEPGWEALLISFPRPPKIGFDLKVAGGLITKIPWLRNELEKMLNDALAGEVLWPRRAVVSAPAPSRTKPLLNPTQVMSLMNDDPLLRMEREFKSSVPDDFRSTFEGSMHEDTPRIDIRQVNETKSDDGYGAGGGGNTVSEASRVRLSVPMLGRFWQRERARMASTAVDEVNAVDMMAQYLQLEAKNGNMTNDRTVRAMILVGVEEKKSWFRRILSEFFLPKSLLSYATREGGI